jgi:hypothetical protein
MSPWIVLLLAFAGPPTNPIPPDVHHVLESVFSDKHDNYTHQIRFVKGLLPWTDEHYSEQVSVVIYRRQNSRAVIQTAYTKGDGVELDEFPFFLRRPRHGWEVTDGEGGPGLWDEVASFVSSLDATALTTVRITPANHSWCRSTGFPLPNAR